MKCDIYKKWDSMGLLENIKGEFSKINLAHGYEYGANKLLSDNENNRRFNSEVNVLLFPILHKIIMINPTVLLTEKFIDEVLDKLTFFTSTELFRDTIDISCCDCCDVEVDPESDLLNIFVELNYGQ